MDSIKWKKYLRIEEEDYSGACEAHEDTRKLHLALIEQLPGGDMILDMGCGTGWSTEELSKKYSKAIGISIQHKEIEFANDKHLNECTEYFIEDMYELHFADKYFDAVYMREALEHSISPFIALCEVNRVLKPGGIFLVNVPDQEWVDWHCHYYVPTPKQLKALLFKTGFRVDFEGFSTEKHFYCINQKINGVKL